MPVRAIRGAVQVEADQQDKIHAACRTLLLAILEENPGLQPEDIASVLFTMTPDLTASYPAQAARTLGWTEVPLLCAQEIAVPGGMPRVIRVLAHWNTHQHQSQVKSVYLGATQSLRPDLLGTNGEGPGPKYQARQRGRDLRASHAGTGRST